MGKFLGKERIFSLFIVFSITIFSVFSQKEKTWENDGSIIKNIFIMIIKVCSEKKVKL